MHILDGLFRIISVNMIVIIFQMFFCNHFSPFDINITGHFSPTEKVGID